MSKNLRHKLTNIFDVTGKLIRYNLKIVFANKFIYFLIAAFAFFVLVTVINLFSDSDLTEGSVYSLLLFPGILIIFYPTTFGIQNDKDARMLEIIFGIPNYRYKVWLVRFVLIYLIVFLILMTLGYLSSFSLIQIEVFDTAFQLMYPIFFLGSLSFMFSTLIKNGNGTAVVMIVIGMTLWILSDIIPHSEWNIFLNPFDIPSDMNETIWEEISVNNRLYLLAGIILSILYGLYNLQERERFL
jgi:hypothetical protein